MRNIPPVWFYNDRAILLTDERPQRETIVESVFVEPDVSAFKRKGEQETSCCEQHPLFLDITRVQYREVRYHSCRTEHLCYNLSQQRKPHTGNISQHQSLCLSQMSVDGK